MLELDVRVTNRLPDRRDITRASHAGMLRAVKAVLRRVEQNLGGRLLRVRTGKLSRSPKARVVVRGNEVVGIIESDVYYGRILNSGAGPHTLTPSGAGFTRRGRRRRGPKVLRFFVGGQAVFMRRVRHPGVRPTLWREQSVLEAEPEIRAAFEAELARQVGAA